mmetsp:Transcript_10833/g.27393  ORF Transcript_10833/g.27393 Transcript_10833/m.27393 type:complete len:1054 (-) Transcript_10833:133-3294(-)|eukprot:CAMPEP_0174235844 /NCGR_PEP_ID=MMETSP0417-20130205/5165_1 /TAXON_ID=242541 /ORGANISM="Mayorella sp, Strain BSH-02190019" /LENGTH=1053 /DNA_ID=CAMNT_0015314405 /DNA_START=165 /DNA_END=3326 /DNA_ORIENTATION=+
MDTKSNERKNKLAAAKQRSRTFGRKKLSSKSSSSMVVDTSNTPQTEEAHRHLLGVALLEAAKNGKRTQILELRSRGAPVDFVDPNNKLGILHLASERDDSELMELLITLGSDVNARDIRQWTPLHTACSCGNAKTADVLIREGARVDFVSASGCSPLHYFCKNRYEDSNHAEKLMKELSRGIGVNMENRSHQTPLHMACGPGGGDPAVISFLLAHGANVNKEDSQLQSPLYLCIQNEFVEAASLLVKAGAIVTPELYHACSNPAIKEFLTAAKEKEAQKIGDIRQAVQALLDMKPKPHLATAIPEMDVMLNCFKSLYRANPQTKEFLARYTDGIFGLVTEFVSRMSNVDHIKELPRYRFRFRKAVECVAGTLKVPSPHAEKFIHTKEGRQFWGEHFKLQGFVSWHEFCAAVLGVYPDVKPAVLEDLTFRSLLDPASVGLVSAYAFGKYYLPWFNPVDKSFGVFENIMSIGGFLPHYSGAESVSRLSVHLPGTFLLRYSQSQPGLFTISFAAKGEDGRVEVFHDLVHSRPSLSDLNPNPLLYLKRSPKVSATTMSDLIQRNKHLFLNPVTPPVLLSQDETNTASHHSIEAAHGSSTSTTSNSELLTDFVGEGLLTLFCTEGSGMHSIPSAKPPTKREITDFVRWAGNMRKNFDPLAETTIQKASPLSTIVGINKYTLDIGTPGTPAPVNTIFNDMLSIVNKGKDDLEWKIAFRSSRRCLVGLETTSGVLKKKGALVSSKDTVSIKVVGLVPGQADILLDIMVNRPNDPPSQRIHLPVVMSVLFVEEKTKPWWNVPTDDIKNGMEKELGKGAGGSVWKCNLWGNTVAVKIWDSGKLQEAPEDYYREINVLMKVQHMCHPNLVQMIGAVTLRGSFAIVQEFCSRGSLHDVLEDKTVFSRLSLRRRLEIGLGTARGMECLHSIHLLHRDMKSLNVLMDGALTPRVADFGMSRPVDQTMTQHSGTFLWMAPEVFNSQKYDFGADVFSFGLVLYELLSGEIPKRTPADVLKANVPPLPPSTPPSLTAVYRACCEANSARRPPFTKIVAALQMLIQQLPE